MGMRSILREETRLSRESDGQMPGRGIKTSSSGIVNLNNEAFLVKM